MRVMNVRAPADFGEQLKKALREIRIGDYEEADRTLAPLRALLPSSDVTPSRNPGTDEYNRLRLATLMAEVADYRGNYNDAEAALHPHRRTIDDLEELHRESDDLHFGEVTPPYRFRRQQLFYLWQQSVWTYRVGQIPLSRQYLNLAIDLAER